MNHNLGQNKKTNEEEAISSAGLVGEGSKDRDGEKDAAILEMVPENGADREVFMQADADSLTTDKGEQVSETDQPESCSRGASREFSRQGRARNSVVYTESPVVEKKRMSKKEEGGSRRNPKSGRVSPLDMNDVVNPMEEVLPTKKKQSVLSQNMKKVKEEGGSRRNPKSGRV